MQPVRSIGHRKRIISVFALLTLLAAYTEPKTGVVEHPTIPTCDNLDVELAKGNSPDEAFDKLMPSILVGNSVNDIIISDNDMTTLMAFLACSAAANDWDAGVPDAAGNLFTSPHHKAAAFAALDALSKGAGENAASARSFAEQMRNYNFGPNG